MSAGAPLRNDNLHDYYAKAMDKPLIAHDNARGFGHAVNERRGEVYNTTSEHAGLVVEGNVPSKKKSVEDEIVEEILECADRGALVTNDIKNYAREKCRKLHANEHVVLDRLKKASGVAHEA